MNGTLLRGDFDNARSGFNGARRQVDINDNQISDADEHAVWYTAAFGRYGRPTAFSGSIRQEISSTNNKYGVGINGPVIGGNCNYPGVGTRAPN